MTRRLWLRSACVALALAGLPTAVAAVPHLRYVALGDSIAFGIGDPGLYGYVHQFRDALQARLRRPVSLTNRSVPGFESRHLLDQLRFDPQTRTAVRNAQVLTVSIGGNNLLGCAGSNYMRLDPACAARGVAAFAREWPQILAQIRKSIRSNARLYVMTLYNPYRGDDPNYATADRFIRQINDVIRSASYRSAYRYKIADVYSHFRGRSRDGNWKVCGWTYFCFNPFRDAHPTRSGHQEIARRHAAIYP